MNKLALAAAALAFPCFVILYVVVSALRRRQPPISLKSVAAFLGLGLLTAVLGEIWCMAADRWLLGRVNLSFYFAFLTATIPEEGFRFLMIFLGVRRRPQVGLVAAMLLGSLVGLTFATYEHVLYAVSSGWGTWLARSFTSVPYHTLSGAVLGYVAADFIRNRRSASLAWLAVVIIVHGLGDWPLDDPTRKDPDTALETFMISGWAGNIASLLIVSAIAVVLFRKAIRTEGENSATR